MAGREQVHREASTSAQAEPLAPLQAKQSTSLTEDLDAILGDIDDVLETNAEEFVRGFVQKGGQ